MKRLLFVAILIISISFPAIAQEDTREWKWENAFESVVLISTEQTSFLKFPKDPNSNESLPPPLHIDPPEPEVIPLFPPKVAMGTGFFIDERHIVTNYHVVQNATAIKIYAWGHPYEIKGVTVVGFDVESDIAVLKLPATPTIDHGILEFATEDPLIGDTVFALGHGTGQMWSLTTGIIGYDTRPNQQSSWVSYLQTDAVINSGNSGGPLLNEQGDVIGVNTLIISPTKYYVGYGYSVPTALVERVANHILEFGKHIKPSIGILMGIIEDQDLFYELRDSGKEHYLEVKGLSEGGAAEQYGIKQGDIIVSIDGKKVQVTNQVIRILWKKMPGDTVSIKIYRNGKYKTYNVVLGKAESTQVRVFGKDPEQN
jgi:serine protease Do